ncbi:hypothetical protein Pint_02351 [Pistacia integerrima]|uniref:Uncharacterized protein n=1 Tax=Pistacia integerrima TaxID=434235 RepID=A0ACC0ZM33_9ROSI|nr:hypothetical protein Pint_02351 [Pistacia integerrima]
MVDQLVLVVGYYFDNNLSLGDLQWILQDWSDEECMKILKKGKEATTSNGKTGKVMIIDGASSHRVTMSNFASI